MAWLALSPPALAWQAPGHPAAHPPTPPVTSPAPATEFALPPASSVPANADGGTGRYAIRAYVFENNRVFSAEALAQLAAPFVGEAVSVGDLEELRQRVTRHLIDHGYVSSGVVVPEHPLRDGVFHFEIVEGWLEEDVRVRGEERLRKGYIANRLRRAAGQPLQINDLRDEFQVLLSDPLIERMNARLLPGTASGASVLDVTVVRARPYQFTLFADNYRPPSIGGEGGGATGWLRNLTGLGDFLTLSFTHSAGADRWSGYWTVPLGDAGTAAYFQFDEGGSSIVEEPLAAIQIDSRIHSLEGGLTQTLWHTPSQRFAVGAALAVRENHTRLLGEPFSFVRGLPEARNQATVLRLSQDFTQRWETQAVALRSTFSVGLHALGATPERDPRYPDSEFFAWLGQAQYVWRWLDNGARLVLRGDMQLSNEPLLPLEQIAVGGMGSVRGYRANQLVRDNGYSASLEIHYPLFISSTAPSQHTLTIIPFMDYGSAWNQGESSAALYSLGLGFNWKFYRLDASLYWGHKLKAILANHHTNIQDDGIQFQVRLDAFE